MQVEIKIDETQKETKVIILAEKMTEEVEELIKLLSDSKPKILAGFCNDILEIIDPLKIIRAYTSGQKVFVVTTNNRYTIKLRLYELEERLDKKNFVRISNSEIINLNKVKGFDLSFSGTICVTLLDGSTTYVSRRYVMKIKHILGI